VSGSHRGDLRGLHVAVDSPVHRLDPAAKLVGTVAFAVVVAGTPRHAAAVTVVEAALLAVVVVVSRIGARRVLARLAVVTPFIMFALAIPFVAHGPRTEVGGVPVSTDGLWAAWNVVARTTLGATAAIVMSATTPLPSMLEGMARLHVPRVVVAIVSSMVRYVELLAAQLARMRTAMVSRGHDPRWLWQVGPVAASVGMLFVRSYERGERVHDAMVARGFTGTLVVSDRPAVATADWVAALAPAAVSAVAVVVWVVGR